MWYLRPLRLRLAVAMLSLCAASCWLAPLVQPLLAQAQPPASGRASEHTITATGSALGAGATATLTSRVHVNIAPLMRLRWAEPVAGAAAGGVALLVESNHAATLVLLPDASCASLPGPAPRVVASVERGRTVVPLPPSWPVSCPVIGRRASDDGLASPLWLAPLKGSASPPPRASEPRRPRSPNRSP